MSIECSLFTIKKHYSANNKNLHKIRAHLSNYDLSIQLTI